MCSNRFRICLYILIIVSIISFVALFYYERQQLLPRFVTKDKQQLNFSQFHSQGTGPTRVLILSYMRSGSSIVGDILQRPHNSTYAFEPLRFIKEDIQKRKAVHFLNGTHRYYNYENSSWVYVDMMYRWFTCDIWKIDVMDLTSVMLELTDSYRQYFYCINSRHRIRHASVSQRRHYIYQCMKLFEKPCNEGKVFIIKTIRLEMAVVKTLLKLLPDLKVIHLIRDPRGKLASELNLQNKEWSSLPSHAHAVCYQMYLDIIEADKLYKTQPQSIKILRYEQFASNPMQKTRNLFRYLNLSFTTEIQTYLKRHTLQTMPGNDCFWCVKNTNAKLTSLKWRLNLQQKTVKVIDQNCETLYENAGFVAINNTKTLRNLSIPLQMDAWIDYLSL